MRVVGLFLLFLAPSLLFGGVYMEDQVKNEKGKIVRQSKTWIEADKLRVDVDTPQAHHTMIYLVNVPKILIINRGKKSYFVMGPKEIAMTKQMFQMQKQRMEQMQLVDDKMMKKQCADLKQKKSKQSKEAQKEIDKEIAGLCGDSMGDDSDAVVWKKNGKATVGKWKCLQWVGVLGKKKVSESCTITTKSVGIKTSDFAVFKLIEQNFSMMNNEEKNSFVKDLKERGMPVRSVSFEAGVAVETTIVTEIKRQSFPATVFQPPKGLKQEKNPMKQVVPHK